MHSTDAESELIRRLERVGIPARRGVTLDTRMFTQDHPALAWKVFKDFGAISMEDVGPEDDGLLFEGGVHDFETLGGRRYHVSFVRQFAYYEDGEYDRMEQLHCCFFYDPTPELESVTPENLWSFGLPLDGFYARVEGMPSFRLPIERRLTPSGLWLEHEQV